MKFQIQIFSWPIIKRIALCNRYLLSRPSRSRSLLHDVDDDDVDFFLGDGDLDLDFAGEGFSGVLLFDLR